MKHSFSLILCLFTCILCFGQVNEQSSIFLELQKMDSILFEEGFNKCNLTALENILDSNFEFYHDQNGAQNKDVFLKGFRESICENPKGKPIRKLVKGSLVRNVLCYYFRNQKEV